MTERKPMENELTRIRAEVKTRRPAEAFPTRRSQMVQHAVQAINVRAIARPVVKTPTRLQVFNAWRRRHYVADQALRVVALLTLTLGALGLALFLLALAVTSLLNGIDSRALVGAVGVLLLLLVLGAFLKTGGSGHGHDGYGFHWTKCKD